ncbi:uncharacterized protein PV06_08646 [Exophiala oligosperma]|uniref:Cupin type-2 domain-containing protein n=2 Tax=Chaetothyriales TaxID=34395 RepID=A0A0D2BMV9_9EURO|nr:uncharacterized protein PV06_08646 [Exophiala oligosperma]KIW38807.1 hypothetical protein PV06_08646 [Exophiala oligosperma]
MYRKSHQIAFHPQANKDEQLYKSEICHKMSSYTSNVSIKKRDTTIKAPISPITQHGRAEGAASISSEAFGTFVGQVWLDPMLKSGDDITVVNVNFQPGARTNWHRHDKGQLLKVTAGSGWVCDQGQKPKRISVGDVIWCQPGGIHWHGADDGSYMVHEAVSLGGIDWYDPVTEEEYAKKTA